MTQNKSNKSLRRFKFLVTGETCSGKSTITKNLPDPKRILYINCDTVQDLAFRNPGFGVINVKNILNLPETLENLIEKYNESHDLIVLDTLTSALSRYYRDFEDGHLGGTNAYAGWTALNTFFESIVKILNSSNLGYLILAHTVEETIAGVTTSKVVTQGKQIGNMGIEHKFANVVSTKSMPISEIAYIVNDYLNITETDHFQGSKYVIQTMPISGRDSYNIRLCSPNSMFLPAEAVIDNDIRALIALNDAYLDNDPNPKTVEEIWEIPKDIQRTVKKKIDKPINSATQTEYK